MIVLYGCLVCIYVLCEFVYLCVNNFGFVMFLFVVFFVLIWLRFVLDVLKFYVYVEVFQGMIFYLVWGYGYGGWGCFDWYGLVCFVFFLDRQIDI